MPNPEYNPTQLLRHSISLLPPGSSELEWLLRLRIIRWNRAVASAVIIGPAPLRLELNPGFVRQFCRTPERLLVLVVHQLCHAMWGHLWPGPWDWETTQSRPHESAVVDAIIAAHVCHRFREERFISFYRDCFPLDRFPGCLLQPPPGWPGRPIVYPPTLGPAGRRALDLLYGCCPPRCTYHDLKEALEEAMREGLHADPAPLESG